MVWGGKGLAGSCLNGGLSTATDDHDKNGWIAAFNLFKQAWSAIEYEGAKLTVGPSNYTQNMAGMIGLLIDIPHRLHYVSKAL